MREWFRKEIYKIIRLHPSNQLLLLGLFALFLAIPVTLGLLQHQQSYTSRAQEITPPVIQPTPTPQAVAPSTIMPIQTGWNLITIDTSAPLTAQTLLANLLSNSHGNLAEIENRVGNNWQTYQVKNATGQEITGANFAIEKGKGYIIYSDRIGELKLSGELLSSAPKVQLSIGWNLLGFPTGYRQYASTVLLDLQSRGFGGPLTIANWNGTWQMLYLNQAGFYGSDFLIDPQKGYFVYSSSSGTYIASFAPQSNPNSTTMQSKTLPLDAPTVPAIR